MSFYDDVYATINEQKEPEVTPEDALLNMKIIEAAMESAKERRIIEL
jgi:predicted dehydrogenase